MLLILDNRTRKDDKFSYTNCIIEALKKYNIEYKIISKIQNIDDIIHKIKGIIIGGSPTKLTKEPRGFLFNSHYISKIKVPIYGICFGCQLLNLLYGGKLVDNGKLICKDYDFYKYNKKSPLFKNLNNTNFRYCFSDVVVPAKNVKKLASTNIKGKILDTAFEFEKGRVFGTLFHPEYYEDTDILILNFYNLCKLYFL